MGAPTSKSSLSVEDLADERLTVGLILGAAELGILLRVANAVAVLV